MANLSDLRKNLLNLLSMLRSLGHGQVQGLCQFIAKDKQWVDLSIPHLHDRIQRISDDELRHILTFVQFWQPMGLDELHNVPNIDHHDVITILEIYYLYILREIFLILSIDHLLKIFQWLDDSHPSHNILFDIQQVLLQISDDDLITIADGFKKVSKLRPGQEMYHLRETVQLEPKFYYLYNPIASLLQMPKEQLLKFHQTFPHMIDIQIILISRLSELHDDISEFYALLAPDVYQEPIANPATDDVDFTEPDKDPPLKLDIIDQPPDKCVYKRNIKPNPTVMVVGDQSEIDGNLYILPVLLRCDTLEEVPKLINGNELTKITTSRIVAFKRLKILSTSHQLNESHFAIRFELRKYTEDNSEYKLLHSTTSTPICVYSHSTQLKPQPKAVPKILEVIPPSGSIEGNTRVVILGDNFVDSPTTRVRFGDIEVTPIFHGGRTLICHTPKHASGKVRLQVCNDKDKWSEEKEFCYDSNIKSVARAVAW